MFNLWWDLRLLKMAPPVVTPLVRVSFTIFEAQMRGVEAARERNGPQVAAALAVGSMAKLMKG